jgi:hypothetical protein
MEASDLDLVSRTLDLLLANQWNYYWDSRYHEVKSCNSCSAQSSRTDKDWDTLSHEASCPHLLTIKELQAWVTALDAETVTEETKEDPVLIVSKNLHQQMRNLAASLTEKKEKAEKEAALARVRYNELVYAAKEFGRADERFRKLLEEG